MFATTQGQPMRVGPAQYFLQPTNPPSYGTAVPLHGIAFQIKPPSFTTELPKVQDKFYQFNGPSCEYRPGDPTWQQQWMPKPFDGLGALSPVAHCWLPRDPRIKFQSDF